MHNMLKGELKVVVAAVVLITVLVILVLVFLAPSGLVNRAFGLFNAPDYLEPVKQDFEQLEVPEAPPSANAAFDGVVAAFKKQGPCVAKYNTVPDGWAISMDTLGESTVVALKSPKGIPARLETLPGHVCVVGGTLKSTVLRGFESDTLFIASIDNAGKVSRITSDVRTYTELEDLFGYENEEFAYAARNFYTNWIQDVPNNPDIYAYARREKRRIISPDYTMPTSIVLNGDTMNVLYGVEWVEMDKEDGGLLYVPEKGKVCVFGTGSFWPPGCNAESEGLDDNCIDDIKLDMCS